MILSGNFFSFFHDICILRKGDLLIYMKIRSLTFKWKPFKITSIYSELDYFMFLSSFAIGSL